MAAPQSWWITAIGVDPLELAVRDEVTGKTYLVPVLASAGMVSFGVPAEVASVRVARTSDGLVWTGAGDLVTVALAADGDWLIGDSRGNELLLGPEGLAELRAILHQAGITAP